MKISELIKELEKLREERGDVNVTVLNRTGIDGVVYDRIANEIAIW